jgi:hypothetical protein
MKKVGVSIFWMMTRQPLRLEMSWVYLAIAVADVWT